jgi:phage/conjugal plasmid C-4 type zinc finger TraR family protein
MPDDIDIAQGINEQLQADALADHFRRQPSAVITSRTHCLDCGYKIPLQRRLAVNGCRRCVSCQEILENWGAL